MKTKLYVVNSAFLFDAPADHRASSGNCQFTVLVAAKNQKRVAELLGQSVSSLRRMGIHETDGDIGYGDSHRAVADIVEKEDTLYYHAGHTHKGYVDKWFEYRPKK